MAGVPRSVCYAVEGYTERIDIVHQNRPTFRNRHLFIGATVDGRFRAFESKTGKLLWEANVDAPAHSVPSTYIGADGRQYVVVPAGGGGFLQGRTGDSIIAFAVPSAKAPSR